MSRTIKGVAFLGEKGGVGKTNLAHAFALGAAWKEKAAYFMHTDDREPITIIDRPYDFEDARNPERLQELARNAMNLDGYFVIDGGGNRPDFDAWIAESMDVILLPVPPDEEAINLALKQMARLESGGAENAYYILNMFPSNRFEQQAAAQEWAALPKNRVLTAVPKMNAISVLRKSDAQPFQTPPSKVNNFARKLFLDVDYALRCIEQGRPVETLKAA